MEKQSIQKLDPKNWVNNYADLLYNYTYKRVFDKHKAEDIVQDTFLSALNSAPNFSGKSTEKTWLISILKNKIVDHYRQKAKNKEVQTSFETPFYQSGDNEKSWIEERAPGNWEMPSSDKFEDPLFMKIFELCLSFLPPKQAAVFALKVLEECPTDELCKELDISTTNYWVIMHRARLQLRECLEKRWFNK